MDKAARLQGFVRRHPSDPLVAAVTQFIVHYPGLAVAFHAQDHLLETPPIELEIELSVVRCHARSASSTRNSWENMWCPMNCSLWLSGTLHNLQRTIKLSIVSPLGHNVVYYPHVG